LFCINFSKLRLVASVWIDALAAMRPGRPAGKSAQPGGLPA
jgi:hypothetical protein